MCGAHLRASSAGGGRSARAHPRAHRLAARPGGRRRALGRRGVGGRGHGLPGVPCLPAARLAPHLRPARLPRSRPLVAPGPSRLRLRAAAYGEGVHLPAVRRPGPAARRPGDGDHGDRPAHRRVGGARRPDHGVAGGAGRRPARLAAVGGGGRRGARRARLRAGPRDARLGSDRPGGRRARPRRHRCAAPWAPVGRRRDRPGDGDQGDARVVPPVPRGHPAMARRGGRGRDLRRHRARRVRGRPVGAVLDPDPVGDRPGRTTHRPERPVPPGDALPPGGAPRAEPRSMAGSRRPGTRRRDDPRGAVAPPGGRTRRRHGHRADRVPDQPGQLGAPPVLGRTRRGRAGRRRGGDAGRRGVGTRPAPGRARCRDGRRSRRRRGVHQFARLVLPGAGDEPWPERVRAGGPRAGRRPAGSPIHRPLTFARPSPARRLPTIWA